MDNNHPFAGVLGKAHLKIFGDIQDMTYAWGEDEWHNGRRLVKFWRQQRMRNNLAEQKDDGKIIQKLPPLVVSCIYWKDKNDYFITSVDCIYLLEGLIGVRFTVEEKNRIRRNLEGFRPLTVSKCKSDSAEFFRLIMGFPHPKPRNIEKDVKVFPWRTLSGALTKIIRKYTPSYSSTAVVVQT
ncbi:hypothetical protein BDB01DRAFT_718292 [Pilobolus umbonatus]|nr:hypothetical protein BDB01DRAFT_718292 [Pilobolus umbonatus]